MIRHLGTLPGPAKTAQTISTELACHERQEIVDEVSWPQDTGGIWRFVDRMRSDDQEVYRKYADQLTRFATSIVGMADAQDVVIDGVVAAMGSTGWPDVRNREAYLYRAVLNAGRSHLRSTGRRRRREARSERLRLASTPKTPIPLADDEVRSAVAGLSARQRAVIFLTYWEDLDERRVAERLGVSVGSVRTHLHRARRHLEGALR